MWPVLVAVGAFVSAVLLRVVDLLIEGRGSWARRAIAADVALLNQLDKPLREGEAGKALERRVSEALTAFGVPEIDADEEQARRRQFERDVDHLEVRVHVIVLGALVVTALVSALSRGPGEHAPMPTSSEWVAIIVVSTFFAAVELKSAHWIAKMLVRRQWRKAGKALPSKRR